MYSTKSCSFNSGCAARLIFWQLRECMVPIYCSPHFSDALLYLQRRQVCWAAWMNALVFQKKGHIHPCVVIEIHWLFLSMPNIGEDDLQMSSVWSWKHKSPPGHPPPVSLSWFISRLSRDPMYVQNWQLVSFQNSFALLSRCKELGCVLEKHSSSFRNPCSCTCRSACSLRSKGCSAWSIR